MPTDPEFNIDVDSPLLIVISGPSGAGKDTVMQRMKERGLRFHFVTTATTRLRQPNEVDGKDYLFITVASRDACVHVLGDSRPQAP